MSDGEPGGGGSSKVKVTRREQACLYQVQVTNDLSYMAVGGRGAPGDWSFGATLVRHTRQYTSEEVEASRTGPRHQGLG